MKDVAADSSTETIGVCYTSTRLSDLDAKLNQTNKSTEQARPPSSLFKSLKMNQPFQSLTTLDSRLRLEALAVVVAQYFAVEDKEEQLNVAAEAPFNV